MALFAARVTSSNLRAQRILARLEIDSRIRAPLVLDRPVDAVGAVLHNQRPGILASRRAAGDAERGAHLVGEGGRAGERRRRGAGVDAGALAVVGGRGGPFGAARPDFAWLEDGAAGHLAGCGDVEGDFGVVGSSGTVQFAELEELVV